MIHPLTLSVLLPFFRVVTHTQSEAVDSVWTGILCFYDIAVKRVITRTANMCEHILSGFCSRLRFCIVCMPATWELMRSRSFFVTARWFCQWLLLQQTEGLEKILQREKSAVTLIKSAAVVSYYMEIHYQSNANINLDHKRLFNLWSKKTFVLDILIIQ